MPSHYHILRTCTYICVRSQALNEAMLTASSKGINLIIANDPDADRFAAAESIKNSDEGSTGTSSCFVLYCSELFH